MLCGWLCRIIHSVIPIARVLVAEHQMFRAMFTEISGVLVNLSGLGEVKRLARLEPKALAAMGTAWFLQHHAPLNWVI